MTRFRTLLLLAATPLTLAACASTPVEAQTAPQGVSAKDRKIGAQEHPKILAQFGGAYTGPGTAMVQRVGKDIAVRSGIAATGSECTVTLLNSTVVNAFALPGCYVYVTRGLLSIMKDEAELASVLGHEIGHVAARHSQKRQQTALGAGIISILGAVLTGSSSIGQLIGQGAQLYTLKFSRTQEYQADDLGIRYMTSAGYDPYASADMLESLEDQAALDTRIRGQSEAAQVPSWARTHPLTADRVTRATSKAKATGLQPGARPRKADSYMTAVDGMLFGDDPEQGFVDGHRFAHPKLRLAFTAPEGYWLNNASDAVTASGPNNVQAQFSGGALKSGETLESYVSRLFEALLGQSQSQAQFSRLRERTLNGMDSAEATARVATQQGYIDATVVAFRWDANTAYHFVVVSPSNVDQSRVVDTMSRSFKRLSDSEAASLRPRVIDVVTVRSGDTLQSMASRMAYSDYQLERFLTINDRESNQPLRAGEKVKIVTYAN